MFRKQSPGGGRARCLGISLLGVGGLDGEQSPGGGRARCLGNSLLGVGGLDVRGTFSCFYVFVSCSPNVDIAIWLVVGTCSASL